MKSLVSTGYVNYDRKVRKYFPTFKVAGLGDWLKQMVSADVQDLLRKIQEETGETVMLAAQNDLNIQYLEVLDSKHEMRFHVEKGSMIPLTRTSLGWMILSTKQPSEVERICRQINARSPAEMRVDISDFLAKLEEIRRQGYCYVPNLPMQAGGCISVLLPVKIGGQQVVIGAGGLVNRLDENREWILRRMRTHIATIDARPY